MYFHLYLLIINVQITEPWNPTLSIREWNEMTHENLSRSLSTRPSHSVFYCCWRCFHTTKYWFALLYIKFSFVSFGSIHTTEWLLSDVMLICVEWKGHGKIGFEHDVLVWSLSSVQCPCLIITQLYHYTNSPSRASTAVPLDSIQQNVLRNCNRLISLFIQQM